MTSFQKFLAEAVATGTLVFAGAGAVLTNTASGGALGGVGVALAHGFAILVMVYAVAHVSGAHINPAITIAHWALRKISTPAAVYYIIAQLLGAVAGAWLLTRIFPDAANLAHLGTPALAAFVGRKAGVVVEAALTAILAWTVFAVTDKRSGAGVHAGLAIGFAIALGVLVGGPLTGAAMNPARFFGPALVAGFWTNHFLYWIGPVVGALAAGYAYRITAGAEEKS